jgi:hypothetical protein
VAVVERRSTRAEQDAPVRTNWSLVAASGLALVCASAASLSLVDDHFALFASGAAIASVACAVASRASSPVAPTTSGTLLSLDGEAMTADELDALEPLGWRSLHHLPLAHGHIDHIVVGPGGVYAVETAMSTSLWTLNVPDARLREAAAQTKRSAAKTRSILRAQGIVVDARPMLVLWGDAVGQADLVEGVAVVRGPDLRPWFEERAVGTFTDADKVESGLAAFVATAQ